jgi:hypothetical protein
VFKIYKFEAVECPKEGCSKTLRKSAKSYKQLPPDALQKYKKIKEHESALKDPNVRLCPNSECDGLLK